MPSVPFRAVPLLLASLLLAPPGLSQARPAVDASKAATVRRLLQLLNAGETMVRGMEAAIPAQRAANPQIPAAFWTAFLGRARRDVPQLIDSLIPIYASRFSQAELNQLVAFYSSPLGKRLAEAQPAMMQESMEIGQRWGAVIGRDIADSLRRSGATVPN